MTERIREFLRKRNDEGPRLVVDLDVVKDNYNAFAKALPDTRVFYAVKANPAAEVLSLLAKLGSCFDPASIPEAEVEKSGSRARKWWRIRPPRDSRPGWPGSTARPCSVPG